MTPQEVLQALDWIPKKRYLELFKETDEAVRKRIRTKAWKEGQQWSMPEGAGVWISIKGVNAWAAAGRPE